MLWAPSPLPPHAPPLGRTTRTLMDADDDENLVGRGGESTPPPEGSSGGGVVDENVDGAWQGAGWRGGRPGGS
jgi:hypothetical protein